MYDLVSTNCHNLIFFCSSNVSFSVQVMCLFHNRVAKFKYQHGHSFKGYCIGDLKGNETLVNQLINLLWHFV